jgi:hypothetical protein
MPVIGGIRIVQVVFVRHDPRPASELDGPAFTMLWRCARHGYQVNGCDRLRIA